MILWQILAILLTFTVVVSVHELGHYWFARWKKMDVEEFCLLGLPAGKKFVLWQNEHGTKFTIHPFVPLGGFVKIKGMEPKSDGSETTIPNGFYAAGLGARALVLFAGPLFSYLGGFALFVIAYASFGRPDPSSEPVVANLAEDSPAQKAGLQAGDRILAVDGKPVKIFAEVKYIVQDKAHVPVRLTVLRGQQNIELYVTPQPSPNVMEVIDEKGGLVLDYSGKPVLRTVGLLGVEAAMTYQPIPLREAVSDAWAVSWGIVAGSVRVLMRPKELKESAAGPIAIVTETGKAADRGFFNLIVFAAFISVSLGFVNLLPIPPFDGGQLLIVGIEALRRGRRLPLRVQENIFKLGFAVILLMFVSVMWLDIGRLFR
ncbi:MAG: RIP metalloprotease [Armatimonadetes bacterium]|nr:RIP metalloprotease [Armatimonadota bacterium]NOG93589.1 RIP metalloprotease [Armatimonadota bacterium]